MLHTTNIDTLWGFGAPKPLTWYGLDAITNAQPRPALILFHGSGRDGRSMLGMWASFAKDQGVILIAPNANASGWSLSDFNAKSVEQILRDAQTFYPIAPDQIYLFGHSGGAKLVQALANQGDGPWRAVASHAGVIDASDVQTAPNPARPIHVFNGDTDQNYPIWYVEKSVESLLAAGHDVSVTLIEGHGHWYYNIGPKLAPLIWDALVSETSG